MGHRRRALLPRREALPHLAHLGALEVAELDGDQFTRSADRGQRPEELGVPVAGDHLRGGHRRETQRVADVPFDERIDVGVGADRTAELAHAHGLQRRFQSGSVAACLQRPQRHLGAERGRLGMDAVGAPDDDGVPMVASKLDHLADEAVDTLDHEPQRVAHCPRQRRVDDITGRQPVVDPGPLRRTDVLLDDVDESRHVVVRGRLPREDLIDERLVDLRRPLAARGCGFGGNDTELGVCLRGEQLHLEPPLEASRVGPDGGHRWSRIAIDHHQLHIK